MPQAPRAGPDEIGSPNSASRVNVINGDMVGPSPSAQLGVGGKNGS